MGFLSGVPPVPAAAAVLLVLALIFAGSTSWSAAGSIAAAALFLGAVQLLLWAQNGTRVAVRPIVWFFLAFAAVQGLSLVASVNRDLTLKTCLLTFATAALALIFSGTGASEHDKDASVNWNIVLASSGLFLALLYESVVGLREYVQNFPGDHSTRIFATFFNPDTTAGFLSMALPLAIALLWLDLPPIGAFVVVLTTVLGAAALALTASKGGWLAFGVGLVALLVLRKLLPTPVSASARKRLQIGGILMLVGAGACSRMLFSRIANAGTAEANSTIFRKLVWESSFRMMIHRPITGFGAGTFGQAYNAFAIAGPTQTAHNSYLQTGAECGILGILLLLAVVLCAVWCGVNRRRVETPDTVQTGQGLSILRDPAIPRILAAGLVAGLVASGVHNAVDFDWSIAGMWLVFGVVAGAAASTGPQRAAWNNTSGRSARACMVAAVFCLAAGFWMGMTAAADSLADTARLALGMDIGSSGSQPDPQAAADLLSTAIRLDPINGSLYQLRGSAEGDLAGSQSDPGLRQSDMAQAVSDLSTAARLMPASAVPLYHLGELQRAAGQLSSAEDSFDAALRRDSHALPAALSLAQVQLATNHPEDARASFQKVAQIETTPFNTVRGVPEAYDLHYIDAWAGLARLDAQSGRWSECITEATHVLDDLAEYAKLADQFHTEQAIFPQYRADFRQRMIDTANAMADLLTKALGHVGQTSREPAIEKQRAAIVGTLQGIKDPSGAGSG